MSQLGVREPREQHRIEFGNTSALTPEASSALEPAPQSARAVRSRPRAASRPPRRGRVTCSQRLTSSRRSTVAWSRRPAPQSTRSFLGFRQPTGLARFEPVGTGATVEPRPGRRPVEAIIARTTVEHVDAGAAEQEIATAPAREPVVGCATRQMSLPAPLFNLQPRICGWQLIRRHARIARPALNHQPIVAGTARA